LVVRQRLKGKVCILTGAATETGPVIARRLAAEGGVVVLAADRPESLQSLMDEIQTGGGEGLAVVTDVAVYNQVRNLVDRTLETFGRVDVMVNNGGFGASRALEDTTPQELDNQVDQGLKSAIYGCKAVVEVMAEHGGGHIVNVGTVASDAEVTTIHRAIRQALLEFSVALDEQVRADGVLVSVLCPPAPGTRHCDDADSVSGAWIPEDLMHSEDLAEL
jgi:NAD(P)-dependent dehydrogenase (short-subunit alcohol dehydrogenase family)